tara:strand:+ start:41310 stop:42644 length:1335 start_codon:yes stop_codon:yes gene_type:complete
MMIFKKALPRRTLIKGAGAAIALPFMGAMVPAMTAQAQTAAMRPKRAGFVYIPHGFIMTDETDWWTPATVGRDFEMSRTLEPLSAFRNQMTVVSNLMGADGSGQHTGATTAWLTDMYPEKTQGADIGAGISIDQVIANQIGQDTIFPSMQLAIEDITSLLGACDSGFSCAYLDQVSWASEDTPLPTQVNPRTVFERMFGGSGTAEQRLARMQQNRSILDSVLEEAHRTEATLDAEDRVRLNDFLENIREVERRIQNSERRSGDLASVAPESPIGVPEFYEEHVDVMYDLLHIAFQADITRVFSLMMARDLSHLSYPQIGVPDPHHSISHHADRPDVMEKHHKVNVYHMQLISRFIDKLATTPDGDGSLLDNSMLLIGSGMSNGNQHVKTRLPNVVISGMIEGNRHIQVDDISRTIGQLHLDMAQQMGLEIADFGRSGGRTVGLA